MTGLKGYLVLLSAVALCPCHLPLFAALLAGTAAGALIAEQQDLLIPMMGAYFVVGLFVGIRWMTQPEKAPTCDVRKVQTNQEPTRARLAASAPLDETR
jgi:hypothetical protein